ncbi:hypothetical protein HMN09_01216600 [Mycena chlorophos]|uniref:Uncharacterized protein n=1 Tax=Mycena chlorophos TaxID=658473 RepID=A0A8H6VY05_MYCCL|nr:hypothetical protein HMN09_01216600 [Mycena chlorophos]
MRAQVNNSKQSPQPAECIGWSSLTSLFVALWNAVASAIIRPFIAQPRPLRSIHELRAVELENVIYRILLEEKRYQLDAENPDFSAERRAYAKRRAAEYEKVKIEVEELHRRRRRREIEGQERRPVGPNPSEPVSDLLLEEYYKTMHYIPVYDPKSEPCF